MGHYWFYLIQNGYVDRQRHITPRYHEDRKNGRLAGLPVELAALGEQVFVLVDGVFSESQIPAIGDDRCPKKNPLKANFEKQAFKDLWSHINQKAAYSVRFNEAELTEKALAAINAKDAGLRVTPLQYTIQHGEQAE
ncbi:MAG: hypothetical protein ORN28_00260 [Rhodoferax sp.]|nr:hypothetical protein [Rhodoferax sp.]